MNEMYYKQQLSCAPGDGDGDEQEDRPPHKPIRPGGN